MELRKKFLQAFNLTDEIPCEGDFDQGRLCTFPVAYGPFGPWEAPEWAVFVPLEQFYSSKCFYSFIQFVLLHITNVSSIAVPWIMQNRGNFDVFVHPNSGWEREDHARWAFWFVQQIQS